MNCRYRCWKRCGEKARDNSVVISDIANISYNGFTLMNKLFRKFTEFFISNTSTTIILRTEVQLKVLIRCSNI